MDPTRLMHRVIDGEASPEEAAALDRLMADRQDLRQADDQLIELDTLLTSRSPDRDHASADALVSRIVDQLPTTAPQRQKALSAAGILGGLAVLGICVPVAWLVGNGLDHNLATLTVGALVVCLLGLLVGFALPPFLRPDSDWTERLLGRRVMMSADQQLVIRCLGIAVLLGGLGGAFFI